MGGTRVRGGPNEANQTTAPGFRGWDNPGFDVACDIYSPVLQRLLVLGGF